MPAVAWQDLLAACAIYLVLEGLMPALAPARFRAALQALGGVDDRALRFIGAGSIIAGLLLLSLVRTP